MSTKNGSTKAPPVPQEPTKQRPVHEIRLGRIRAAIWANQNDNGTWYNVTLSRSYKDGDDWRSSASFGRDELLTLAKVADLANSWIHEQSQSSNGNGREGEESEESIPY
jgi:hypothetical protein